MLRPARDWRDFPTRKTPLRRRLVDAEHDIWREMIQR